MIEKLLRSFLWSGPDLKQSGAKVAWNAACVPKDEGGLVLRMLKTWNKASILRHLWSVCLKADTIWIKWVPTYVLKRPRIWKAKILNEASWTIRKLLNLREVVQPWIKYIIGDGSST